MSINSVPQHLVLQLEGKRAEVTFIGKHLMDKALVRTKSIALRKGGAAKTALVRPKALMKANMATQTGCSRECIGAVRARVARLARRVHAHTVVVQQCLVSE